MGDLAGQGVAPSWDGEISSPRTAPYYLTPAGHAQGCLGRLIRIRFTTLFSAPFSDEVWDAGDVL